MLSLFLSLLLLLPARAELRVVASVPPRAGGLELPGNRIDYFRRGLAGYGKFRTRDPRGAEIPPQSFVRLVFSK